MARGQPGIHNYSLVCIRKTLKSQQKLQGYDWSVNKVIALYQRIRCPMIQHTVLFPRYHTGSLAFGAAIIAIVQFIRAILEYVDHKLKGDF